MFVDLSPGKIAVKVHSVVPQTLATKFNPEAFQPYQHNVIGEMGYFQLNVVRFLGIFVDTIYVSVVACVLFCRVLLLDKLRCQTCKIRWIVVKGKSTTPHLSPGHA
jgi:hypothetical protein